MSPAEAARSSTHDRSLPIPDIWPPLLGAIFLAALGLYSWRRRSAPGAMPSCHRLAVCGAVAAGNCLVAAAVAPATKIAWYKFQTVWQLPAVTAMTCFVLEYAYPGRWLTRRNLSLLALPCLWPCS